MEECQCFFMCFPSWCVQVCQSFDTWDTRVSRQFFPSIHTCVGGKLNQGDKLKANMAVVIKGYWEFRYVLHQKVAVDFGIGGTWIHQRRRSFWVFLSLFPQSQNTNRKKREERRKYFNVSMGKLVLGSVLQYKNNKCHKKFTHRKHKKDNYGYWVLVHLV